MRWKYHIKRFTMYRAAGGYVVEVYSPRRGKKFRKYTRVYFDRVCKLCQVFDNLVDAEDAYMSITPDRFLMSVAVEIG